DHFLSLDPTYLDLASFETRLLEAETSTRALAASRGTPRTPLFAGCAPSIFASSIASAAAVDLHNTEMVDAVSTPNVRHGGSGGRRASWGGGGGGGGATGRGGGGGGGGGSGSGGGAGKSGEGGEGRAVGEGGGSRGGQQPVEAASVGACESASTGAAPAEALHTFMLDSGASRCFFRDRTTVIPLTTSVPVTLADPCGDPVVARGSTILPCELVEICTDSVTGDHLATFTRRPGSGPYTLHSESAQVAASNQAEVRCVLIPCIRALRHQLRARFQQDLSVLRLHSIRGGEFSSYLLEKFCHKEGITQSFMLPASPQQNGIAECHIGLIMEVARTSMIHAVAPYFMWPLAVRYAVHQLNLWPRVSQPETSPTVLWMGEVGDASAFRTPSPRQVLLPQVCLGLIHPPSLSLRRVSLHRELDYGGWHGF
ncbi:unnamed protein product, partial [Closterium sp. NIES-53]